MVAKNISVLCTNEENIFCCLKITFLHPGRQSLSVQSKLSGFTPEACFCRVPFCALSGPPLHHTDMCIA